MEITGRLFFAAFAYDLEQDKWISIRDGRSQSSDDGHGIEGNNENEFPDACR